MSAELNAIYHAAILAKGHAVFYRLPNEAAIYGAICEELNEIPVDGDGFIIKPFSDSDSTRIVTEEIAFRFLEEISFSFNKNNRFTKDLQTFYSKCFNKRENNLVPFFNGISGISSSKQQYISAVENAVSEIKAGNITKVVLSRCKPHHFVQRKHPINIFLELCSRYPGAFVNLISSPVYGTWIGASPESLLEQQNEYYCTMALAGTKKSKELSSFTTKEVKEQKIIQEYIQELLLTKNIDAVFSDISAYRAGELTHLKTKINFSATASERISIATMLHPTPAVGGVPRESAINFIANHENYNRELYAGYFGPIKKNAMQLFVNIRCMQWTPDNAILYAGAGITEDSDPLAEFEETENKMNIIGSVL